MNRGVLTGLGPGDAPDVLTGDAGQNALVTTLSTKSIRLVNPTSAQVIDTVGYRCAVVVIASISGSVITNQSDDAVNWAAYPTFNVAAGVSQTVPASSFSATGAYVIPLFGRYIRFAGTCTGTVYLTDVIPPVVQVTYGNTPADAYANAQNPTPANPYVLLGAYNGFGWDRQRTPTTFKTATATASGDTAVWTPASGKKFRLMRYRIEVTGDAATASGAEIDIVLRDGTTATAHACSLYVPAAGGTLLGGYTTGWVDAGNGQLSSAANAVLNVNLSAALSAGKVRVVACGTEE